MFFHILNTAEKVSLLVFAVISVFFLIVFGFSKGVIIFSLFFFLTPAFVITRIVLKRTDRETYEFLSDIWPIFRNFLFYFLPGLFFLGLLLTNSFGVVFSSGSEFDLVIIYSIKYGTILFAVYFVVWLYLRFKKWLNAV